MAQFEENKHPRDEEGKFTNKDISKEYRQNTSYGEILGNQNATSFYEDISEGTLKKLKELESKSGKLEYEVGTILDKNGNVLQSANGEVNSVSVDKNLLKDAIFTHNHPTGCCFSDKDIYGFVIGELYQLRATTKSGKTYILTKIKDVVEPSLVENFKKATKPGGEGEKAIQKLYENFLTMGYPNYRAVELAISNYREEWLYKNCKTYGVKFSVEF